MCGFIIVNVLLLMLAYNVVFACITSLTIMEVVVSTLCECLLRYMSVSEDTMAITRITCCKSD